LNLTVRLQPRPNNEHLGDKGGGRKEGRKREQRERGANPREEEDEEKGVAILM